MKKVVTGVLLVFVLASLGYLVVKEAGEKGAPVAAPIAVTVAAGVPGEASSQAAPRKLVLYYVHGNKRCNTCRAMESQSKQALEEGFPEALMSGRLEWQSVNADEPANEHFYTDYSLTGSSLVMADFVEGRQARFKVLTKTWDLAADPPAFLAYVQDEVRPWLEAPR